MKYTKYIMDLYSGIPQKEPEITIKFRFTLNTANLGYISNSFELTL